MLHEQRYCGRLDRCHFDVAHRVYDIEAAKECEISSNWSLLKHTYIHEVRGTGREDQVPARAVADIGEKGVIDFKFLPGFSN